MKMFDHCVARITLHWNDNVLSAYRIASVGEHKRGRKQGKFVPKNAIHFVRKLIIFQNGTSRISTNENWDNQHRTCIKPQIKCHSSPGVFNQG